MSTIREAVKDTSREQWYIYDQQFRVSRDHIKNWAEVDGQLWVRFIATKPQILTSPNRKKMFWLIILKVHVIDVIAFTCITALNVDSYIQHLIIIDL